MKRIPIILLLFSFLPISVFAVPVSIPTVDVRPATNTPLIDPDASFSMPRNISVSNLVRTDNEQDLFSRGDKNNRIPDPLGINNSKTTYFQLLYGFYEHLNNSLYAAAMSASQDWIINLYRDRSDDFYQNKKRIYNSQTSIDDLRVSHGFSKDAFSLRNMLRYANGDQGLQDNIKFDRASAKDIFTHNTVKYAFSSSRSVLLDADYDYGTRKIENYTNESSSEMHSVFINLGFDMFANDVFSLGLGAKADLLFLNTSLRKSKNIGGELALKNEFVLGNMAKLKSAIGVRSTHDSLYVKGNVLFSYIPSDILYLDLYIERDVSDKTTLQSFSKIDYLSPLQSIPSSRISASGGVLVHFLAISKFNVEIKAGYKTISGLPTLYISPDFLYALHTRNIDLYEGEVKCHATLLPSLFWNAGYKIDLYQGGSETAPGHSFISGLQFSIEKFKWNLDFNYLKNTYSNFKAQGYEALGFSTILKVQLQRRLWGILQGENIFNAENKVAGTYYISPITLSLGLRFDLQ